MPVAKEKNSCHWSHKMYNYESSEAANSYILFSLIKRTVHWKKKKSVLKKAKQEFEKKKKKSQTSWVLKIFEGIFGWNWK